MGRDQQQRPYTSRITHDASRACLLVLATVVVWPALGHAAELLPPKLFQVFDTPSDGGGGLTAIWAPADYDGPEVRYQVILQGPELGVGESGRVLAEFPSTTRYVRDVKAPWWNRPAPPDFHRYDIKSGKGIELKSGTRYVVTVKAVRGEERAAATMPAVPAPNWIN